MKYYTIEWNYKKSLDQNPKMLYWMNLLGRYKTLKEAKFHLNKFREKYDTKIGGKFPPKLIYRVMRNWESKKVWESER